MRCVINVAVGHWYPNGQQRLGESLERWAPQVARRFWCDRYPEGSPTHAARPYAFKAFAIQDALRQGFTQVIWMDASCWVIRPLDALWAALELQGTLLVTSGYDVGTWSTDRSLAALAISRDEAMQIPMVLGGFFGLDLARPEGRQFADSLFALAQQDAVYCGAWKNDRQQCSADPRVQGHRHDMVAMGIVTHQLRLPHAPVPPYFSYDHPHPHAETVVLARGM